jgi:hypothetical protein
VMVDAAKGRKVLYTDRDTFFQVYIYNLAIFSIFLSDIYHVRVRLTTILLGKRSLKHKHLHTCRNIDLFTSPVTLKQHFRYLIE